MTKFLFNYASMSSVYKCTRGCLNKKGNWIEDQTGLTKWVVTYFQDLFHSYQPRLSLTWQH